MKATLQQGKYGLKKIQACAGFELMTSVIPVQRSTNWTNKPTGSWLLSWFQINPWSDELMTVNIRKSYKWTAEKEMSHKSLWYEITKEKRKTFHQPGRRW